MTEFPPTSETKPSQASEEHERHEVLRSILNHRVGLLREADIPLQSDPDVLLNQLIRFIDFFEISIGFFQSSSGIIRPYVLIGLVDAWIQTTNLHEKSGLFELVKILTSNEWLTTSDTKQWSVRVIKHALAGKRMGTEFISGYKPGLFSKSWQDKRKVAEEHTDTARTDELNANIGPGENSPLQTIRLKIGSSETETPFTVRVLTLSRREMAKMFNGTIAFYSEGILCVPSDYDYHLVEHEYIHSQQVGFNWGYNNILGRALMEAWTEQQTQDPVYYEDPRRILLQIQNHLPDFTSQLQSFADDPTVRSLDNTYLHLLSGFGLRGLISLLRLETDMSCTSDKSNDYHGKYIFQTAHKVEDQIAAAKLPSPSPAFESLSNITQYRGDDIQILEFAKKYNSELRVDIEHLLHTIEFESAIEDLKKAETGALETLSAAIQLYLKFFSNEYEYCGELLPFILKQYLSLNSKDVLTEMIIDCLEAAEGVESIRSQLYYFRQDLRRAASKEDDEVVSKVEKLFEDLFFHAYLRHTERLALGADVIDSMINAIETLTSQAEAEKIAWAWNQIKGVVVETNVVGVRGLKDTFTLAKALVNFYRKCNNDQMRIQIKTDIEWLLGLAKELSSSSQDDIGDYTEQRINGILDSLALAEVET